MRCKFNFIIQEHQTKRKAILVACLNAVQEHEAKIARVILTVKEGDFPIGIIQFGLYPPEQ